MPDFIYSMYKVSRHYPPDRDVLKDISLSFFYGAKIGVIGPNGAGKSSLLYIMAGRDQGYTGQAKLEEGFSVGMLEQEPQLDPAKDVLGNVMDGVAATKALLDEYNEVLAGWADPEADYEKLGSRQEALEKKIEAASAWELDRQVEMAMDALRLPPGDADVAKALRWGAAPGGALSAASFPSGSAAARRAHQPSRRRVGGLAGAFPPRIHRHRHRHHSRSLFPRQRRRLDPRARPGPGLTPSRATTPAGWSRKRLAWRKRRRRPRPGSGRWPGSWSGCGCHPEPARPRAKRGSPGTRI